MPDTTPPQGGRWQVLEFALVVVMLGILTILVVCVLLIPESTQPQPMLPAVATVEQVFKYQQEIFAIQKATHAYRKDILSLILTAFGAWVGAGAAYFFGRESLRDANTLLEMREASPKDQLNQTKVSELPLKPLEFVVKPTDLLQPVIDRLKQDNKLWFVTVVDAQGKLVDVIHKEGIWRYVVEFVQEIASKTIADVRTFLTANETLRKSSLDIYVPVKLDMTVGQAHDLLTQKDIYIAVVIGPEGKPLQYFDTGDIRRFLLK